MSGHSLAAPEFPDLFPVLPRLALPRAVGGTAGPIA